MHVCMRAVPGICSWSSQSQHAYVTRQACNCVHQSLAMLLHDCANRLAQCLADLPGSANSEWLTRPAATKGPTLEKKHCRYNAHVDADSVTTKTCVSGIQYCGERASLSEDTPSDCMLYAVCIKHNRYAVYVELTCSSPNPCDVVENLREPSNLSEPGAVDPALW